MAETESTGQLSRFHSAASSPQEPRILAPGDSSLIVPTNLFSQTLAGLKERSDNYRESAAIWAGTVDKRGWRAQRLFFHHELCDDHSGPLFLELSEDAKFHLYRELAAENLRMIALIHTHPAAWVGLSPVDERNQLSSRIGFWSIVIPHYAQQPSTLSEMGVHVRTSEGWHQLEESEVVARVVVAI